MGKKANIAVIAGGLGLLALLAYKSMGGKAAAGDSGGNGGGGGGAVSDFLEKVFSPAQQTINDVVSKVLSGQAVAIGPASEEYGGGVYPALNINEQGLYYNRETGYVYPVDPVTGRQRARVENGEVVGRYIASKSGVPYGTYEYTPIPEGGITEYIDEETSGLPGGMTVTHKKTSQANVLITSKATGITQAALVGTNPSTGESWVWYGI